MSRDTPYISDEYVAELRKKLTYPAYNNLYMGQYQKEDIPTPEMRYAMRGTPASYDVPPYTMGGYVHTGGVVFNSNQPTQAESKGTIVKQFVIPFEGVNRGVRVQAETSLDGENLIRINIAQVKVERTTVIDAVSEDEVETVRVVDTYGVTLNIDPEHLSQVGQAVSRMSRYVSKFNAEHAEGESE